MMLLQHTVKQLVVFGGFAAAVAAAPLLGAGIGNADPGPAECPPGESANVYAGTCVPVIPQDNSPLGQAQLSQPGGGYDGPAPPEAVNAPSEQLVTICSGGDQSNCLEQSLYGPQSVPNPSSSVSSSP